MFLPAVREESRVAGKFESAGPRIAGCTRESAARSGDTGRGLILLAWRRSPGVTTTNLPSRPEWSFVPAAW